MNRRMAALLVTSLVLVDLILVFVALRQPETATAASPLTGPTTSAPVTSGPPTASGSVPSKTPSPSATPTGGRTDGTAPLQLTLAALDRTTAWRATVGTCTGGGSLLEATSDGGRTWARLTSPVGAIVRAQPLENRRGFVIGADRDCALTQFSTGDGGKTWVKQATEGGWARALDRPNEALTPRLDRSRPCGDRPIVDLSRASADQGQALCANGELKVTSDGGATWSDAGVAEGGLALSTRLEQGVLSTYVARVDKACAGVQVVRAVAGQQPRPVACVGSTTTAKPGIVSLSTVSDGGWLRVGDETWTAPGSLESWARA